MSARHKRMRHAGAEVIVAAWFFGTCRVCTDSSCEPNTVMVRMIKLCTPYEKIGWTGSDMLSRTLQTGWGPYGVSRTKTENRACRRSHRKWQGEDSYHVQPEVSVDGVYPAYDEIEITKGKHVSCSRRSVSYRFFGRYHTSLVISFCGPALASPLSSSGSRYPPCPRP